MKHSITRLVMAAGAVAIAAMPPATAGTRKRVSAPVVITLPAVPDGSNWSRAPFPAARPQNDVTPPNGEAFDENLPPNTPSTTPQPVPLPVPRLAILEPQVAPGLTPTGQPVTSLAAALDAAQMEPAIRAVAYETREELIDGIRVRVRKGETGFVEIERTRGQMSAEGRSRFDAVADDVRARDKVLERSLRAADRASIADWESVREQVASDYSAYAAALAQVDAAAGIAPAR